MVKLQIQEVMTKDVESVGPEAGVDDVLTLMLERRISCVLVCEEGIPLGVISERDFVRRLSESLEGRPLPETAGQLMSSPPVTVEQFWSVDRAMEVVQEKRIRRLPVVDRAGVLVGLVTQTDLLDAQHMRLARTVEVRTRELQAANDRLRALSLKDGLLEIGNRRAMNEMLEKAHRLAERYDRPYSVVLADVDHFKAYNDYYGHPEADEVLKRIANALCETARASDTVFRYGGEEILVLLPETAIEGARTMAERVVAAVRALDIASEPTAEGFVTVSCGMASSHTADGGPSAWLDVLSRADASLYDAKRSGRNRVGAVSPS